MLFDADPGPWVLLQCSHRHGLVSISCTAGAIEWGADSDDPDVIGTVHAAWPVASSAVDGRTRETVEGFLTHQEDDRVAFRCPRCSQVPVITRSRLVGLYDEAVTRGQARIRVA